MKYMKMHQVAFVQKCAALTSSALPRPTEMPFAWGQRKGQANVRGS